MGINKKKSNGKKREEETTGHERHIAGRYATQSGKEDKLHGDRGM